MKKLKVVEVKCGQPVKQKWKRAQLIICLFVAVLLHVVTLHGFNRIDVGERLRLTQPIFISVAIVASDTIYCPPHSPSSGGKRSTVANVVELRAMINSGVSGLSGINNLGDKGDLIPPIVSFAPSMFAPESDEEEDNEQE